MHVFTLFQRMSKLFQLLNYVTYDRQLGVLRCNLCGYEVVLGFGYDVVKNWHSAWYNMFEHFRERHGDVYYSVRRLAYVVKIPPRYRMRTVRART